MQRLNSIIQKATILIVDDEAVNLRLLEQVLRKEEYNVIKATNGQEALSAANEFLPNLVLLDISMPVMDGLEACEQLKQNKRTQDIPVIFFSSATDTKMKLKGFKVGAVDYITKPLSSAEILARVNIHVKLFELKAELDHKNLELNQINQNLEEQVQQKTRELIQQEKSAIIGRLIQGMIHNLRSPLTAIIGYNELILNHTDSAETAKYSEIIEKATKQMQSMMDNLMMRSSKDHKEKIENLSLNCIIKQELALLDANLHFKHQVNKNVNLDDTLPNLNLVYSDISQVFHNLLNNALDAMWKSEKQEIIIRTYHDQNSIFLDVQDNGSGISADKLELIFDPFYTSKPAIGEQADSEPVGTGLGLHSCKDLIKHYGGDIKVESVLHKGSTFTIILPKNI